MKTINNLLKSAVITGTLLSFSLSSESYGKTEGQVAGVESLSSGKTEVAVIKTSKQYQIPTLFTVPTAYALQPWGFRFGGEGNIHSTIADFDSDKLHISAALGLGGVVELGYQLEEYHTVNNSSDNMVRGLMKLSILKEAKFRPALAISAGQNLRENFEDASGVKYVMERRAFDIVTSKSFKIGHQYFGIHPGVSILWDDVKEVNGQNTTNSSDGTRYEDQKINYRLGVSWQSQPKVMYMYEAKYFSLAKMEDLETVGIQKNPAIENNIGVRYYIRNWLCMDAGIRYLYDLEEGDDDMKLHANFVGVVPLNTVFQRVENLIRK